MLVCVALLVVFVSMAAVGMTGLFGSGEQMAAASKAAVLGADALDAVAGELRLGENFSGGGDAVSYRSAFYGEGCTMTVEEGRLVVYRTEEGVDGKGEPAVMRQTYYPVGESDYGDVTIGSLTFTMGENGAIGVALAVAGPDGNTLWSNQTTVVPLSEKLE